MAAKSNFLCNKLLDHVLKATSYSAPATVYLTLYTANPTASDSGTEVTTSGTAYSRQAMSFASASGQASASNSTITFPQATGSWGTVTHWGIRDAASGGNLLYFGAFNTSKTVTAGDQFIVSSGNLTVSES